MIANKDARALGIKAWRTPHFELHSCKTNNIPEKEALRRIIFARIDDETHHADNHPDHSEVDSAHGPQGERAHR
jgi:hypothetical protein